MSVTIPKITKSLSHSPTAPDRLHVPPPGKHILSFRRPARASADGTLSTLKNTRSLLSVPCSIDYSPWVPALSPSRLPFLLSIRPLVYILLATSQPAPSHSASWIANRPAGQPDLQSGLDSAFETLWNHLT